MPAENCLAGFETWSPTEYLADYYREVEEDERRTLPFLVRQYRRIPRGAVALEFGIGPTLHHLLPLSPHVAAIDVADLLPANLEEVRRWQRGAATAHDWRPFTTFVLAQEQQSMAGPRAIAEREELTRRRIRHYLVGDASQPNPLGAGSAEKYDCVVSCYCADSATGDRSTWRRYVHHIMTLVRPGGFFVITALRNCRSYQVGNQSFPSANIDERDIADLFAESGVRDATIEVADTPEHAGIGYDSVVLAAGFVADRPGRSFRRWLSEPPRVFRRLG